MHHCGGGGELVCQSLRTEGFHTAGPDCAGRAGYVSPFFPDATLDPELFMVLFIAPLLYLEAHEIDKSALLKTLDLSLSLAIGLAIVTMAAVGFTLHAVWPSITLASALALGAALGRPMPVAVSSLGKEASLTQRQRSVLKGESLFNDASGIGRLPVRSGRPPSLENSPWGRPPANS